ncbi:uncharacterized protein LOC143182553 [Calliopsis andreniformis]|uniref:uncharacterized protein LOC143182553 n=1 Tax=Calliopsis andreniformis TaxID=337506 RepID=UPI003FCCE213
MAVHVKCERSYGKTDLKKMIESCGCCPPMGPQCPPVCPTSESPIMCCTPCCEPKCPSPPTCVPCCPQPCSVPCPPQPCVLPCPPRPFICPPCTGYPCITCAPLPKPVPAPFEFSPVIRTPITTGGLFYTGTIKCYPCYPCMPSVC